MKNRALALCLVSACVALAGCSGMSKTSGKSSSVPIEDRSSGIGADSAAKPAVDAASVSGTGAGANAGAGAAAAGGGGSAADQARLGGAASSVAPVETHALPGTASQGQALGTTAAPDPRDTGNPVTDTRFKDPQHLLSKRLIYFDFDSFTIREEFRPLIEAHATYLREHQGVRAILQGHTDERGSRDYNLALGQRRAESVQQAMSLMGVKDGQIEAVSLGEEKPAQEGHDESAWQLNRRTEIYYQGE